MWIIFALIASIFWGFTYVLDERILRFISVSTSLSIASLSVFAITALISFATGNLFDDIAQISSSRNLSTLIIYGTTTLLIAEFFIGLSISNKNSVLAGFIEISYPLFIALFSYLLFHNARLNLGVVIGGILIFAGIVVIYFYNA